MKAVKSQIVLYIYSLLANNQDLNTDEVCQLFKITKRTYFNYISEIKSFLANFYPEKELYYSFRQKRYILK